MLSNVDILENNIDEISNIKNNLSEAIYGKGVFVSKNTPFINYADYISNIQILYL